ncbi:MAG TPA: phage holin family protein [Geminicoccaceae bacterium]|nr:phage holin family protein [Geminicoccaceae bacterium]
MAGRRHGGVKPMEERSLRDLVADLGSSITTLFRKEIQLARAETSEKISQAGGAVAVIAAGGVLALAALIVLLEAIVIAIADAGLPPAAAAAIVGVAVAVLAYVLIHMGIRNLRASQLVPSRTVDALKRDAQVAEEHLS